MSQIEGYLTAKNEFTSFEVELKALAQLIRGVGAAIENSPGRMIFSNTQQGLPMEASMSHDSKSFNADQWKSAAQIQEMLAKWHQKRDAMMEAWNSIPAELRQNVIPPDGQGPAGGSPGVSWGRSRR